MGEHLHTDSNKPDDGKSTHKVGDRVLGHELSEIKERDDPRKFAAGKVQILREAKDGCVIETLLVEILEETDESHQRHDDSGQFLDYGSLLVWIDGQRYGSHNLTPDLRFSLFHMFVGALVVMGG